MTKRLGRKPSLTRSAMFYQIAIMPSSSTKRPQPTSEKLLMSIVDSTLPINQGQRLGLSTLSCGAQPTSLFLKVPHQTGVASSLSESCMDDSHRLCEIQSLPAEFASFLVTPSNTLIGKDSNLYVTTPVDPLFFVLQHEPDSDQWQPWDQIVQGMDPILRSILPVDRNQLTHLFARMPISDDECYYKFSVHKSLQWLEQKFARVKETLEAQQTKALESVKKGGGLSSNGTSSTASNFHLGKQATSTTSSEKTDEELRREQERHQAARRKRMTERCQADALQIVCEYLNDTWTKRFLAHMNLDASLLEPPKAPAVSAKRPALTDLPAPVVKKPKPSTIPSKLAKVPTKGMQKMTAFFAKKVTK